MINIPIVNLPNQSLSIQLDQINYDLTLLVCNNIMTATLSIDNTLIVSGIRLVPNFPLIASKYLENGNFIIVTENDEYPYWLRFGIDQFLIYASVLELQEIAAGTFVVPV